MVSNLTAFWYHSVDDALLRRIVEEHLGNNRPVEYIFRWLDGASRPEVIERNRDSTGPAQIVPLRARPIAAAMSAGNRSDHRTSSSGRIRCCRQVRRRRDSDGTGRQPQFLRAFTVSSSTAVRALVTHNATLPHMFGAGFELRLDQRDDPAIPASRRSAAGKDQCRADKAGVDDGEIPRGRRRQSSPGDGHSCGPE